MLFLFLSGKELPISKSGIFFAMLAGVAIGLAEITYFFAYSKGVPASVAIPIVMGGTVLLGSILGIIFLKESLNIVSLLALGMIFIGILLLSFK